MPRLETFSTAELPPHRRLEYWNDLAGSAFTPLVTDPVDRRAFVGRLVRTQVGEIRMAEARSDPAIVRHSRQHVARSREAIFMLCLQLDGVSINRQQGRESILRYGDFHLLDSSRPYELTFQQSNRMLVLSIPHADLARRMPNPESLVAIPMSGRNGVAGLLSTLLCNFWQQRRTGDETFLSPRFSEAILDLTASAFAGIHAAAPEGSSIAIARRDQIRTYVETHLHDPTLTSRDRGGRGALVAPSPATSFLKLTVRQLAHTSCAAAWRNAPGRCRMHPNAAAPSRNIAFLHGFNNASHFGRVFRERYQATPSDFRRRAIAAA